jgi:hypothetical protein
MSALAMVSVTGCAHITHPVTARYPIETHQEWCLTSEAFAVYEGCWGCELLTGTPNLKLEPGSLSKTVKRADVRADLPAGSRFRIVKVIERHGSLLLGVPGGPWLGPYIVFDGEFERLGRIDASYVAYTGDLNQLDFWWVGAKKAAVPCGSQQ